MAQNGIDFLLDQHRQIQRLLDAVQEGTPQARQQSFDALRELLAVHETAEELILRPATRKEVEGGSAIADARMAEENEAKETLAKLEKLKAGEPEFDELFARFAGDVLTHASNEEAEEFPRLRQQMSEKALATMGSLLEKAEKLAPTHPHPSARSTTANVVLGPFATMVDKVKDSVSGLRS